nr:neurotrophin 1-like [Cherax quadricarinatus]
MSSLTEKSDVSQAPKSSTLTYNPVPYSFHRRPSYHQRPHYGHGPVIPQCAANTTKSWCIEDDQYPTYEIKHALGHHYEKVLSLYANLDDFSTELSVKGLMEETYLCPSETTYIRPLRAKNTEGKWHVIVNHIKIHYVTLSQITRIEECLTPDEDCPLVPECYDSTCLQKSIYHRFLVYDLCDQYFPFAIETFKLPASCACLLDSFNFDR